MVATILTSPAWLTAKSMPMLFQDVEQEDLLLNEYEAVHQVTVLIKIFVALIPAHGQMGVPEYTAW